MTTRHYCPSGARLGNKLAPRCHREATNGSSGFGDVPLVSSLTIAGLYPLSARRNPERPEPAWARMLGQAPCSGVAGVPSLCGEG